MNIRTESTAPEKKDELANATGWIHDWNVFAYHFLTTIGNVPTVTKKTSTVSGMGITASFKHALTNDDRASFDNPALSRCDIGIKKK